MPMAELVHQISRQREYGNLSSALRLFVLEHYLSRTKAKRDMKWCKARSAHRPETRSSCRSACPLPRGQPYIADIFLWQAVLACVPVP